MIDLEDPDLIVFTGDNIYGADAVDPIEAMELAYGAAIEKGIPWAGVFGNHDAEGSYSRSSMMEWMAAQPYSLSVAGPDFGELCVGNYRLDVLTNDPSSNASALTLYLLDSRAYSEVPGIGGYDWIQQDQIQWYSEQAAAVAQAALPSAPPPALAFFHIPLPEYASVAESSPEKVGDVYESVCSPNVNSGFFEALEASGNVVATSVGHDHNNNFCSPSTANGPALCYGGGTGYGTYGQEGLHRMQRVFTATLGSAAQPPPGSSSSSSFPLSPPSTASSAVVASVSTHKRLDDANLTLYSAQALFPAFALPTIAELTVVHSSADSSVTCPSGFARATEDLNAQEGGEFVYLCALTTEAAATQAVVNRVFGVREAGGGTHSSSSSVAVVVNVSAVVGTNVSDCPQEWFAFATSSPTLGRRGNAGVGVRSSAALTVTSMQLWNSGDPMQLCVLSSTVDDDDDEEKDGSPRSTLAWVDAVVAVSGTDETPAACPQGFERAGANLNSGCTKDAALTEFLCIHTSSV